MGGSTGRKKVKKGSSTPKRTTGIRIDGGKPIEDVFPPKVYDINKEYPDPFANDGKPINISDDDLPF
jgi:single-stranded DNA-binding protein